VKKAFALFLLLAALAVGAWYFWVRPAAEYGLLVFGPEGRVRVWVTVEGDRITLERQDDPGRPPGVWRFAQLDDCRDVEIADPDGQTRYLLTHLCSCRDASSPRHSLLVNVDIKGAFAYRQYADMELVRQPSQARRAHFHGPLAVGPRTIMWKVPPELALQTGDKPTELGAIIGTMDAERGCWVAVCTHHDGGQSAFPGGVAPVVDVEFPPKEPGGPPVKRRYSLDKFC
jgi:hypothetical protein